MVVYRRSGHLKVVLSAAGILAVFLFFAMTDSTSFGQAEGPRPTPSHDAPIVPLSVSEREAILGDPQDRENKQRPARTRPKLYGNQQFVPPRPQPPPPKDQPQQQQQRPPQRPPPQQPVRAPPPPAQKPPAGLPPKGKTGGDDDGKAKWVAAPFGAPDNPMRKIPTEDERQQVQKAAEPVRKVDFSDKDVPKKAPFRPEPMKPGKQGTRKKIEAFSPEKENMGPPAREPGAAGKDVNEATGQDEVQPDENVMDLPRAPPRPNAAGQRKAQGWGARFKQKPIVLNEDEKEESQVETPTGMLAHPLVSAIASRSLRGENGAKPAEKVVAAVPEEDSFQADSVPRKVTTKPLTTHAVAVCAMIPSEQRFLPEWLLYHRMLGVTHFALYDTGVAGAAGAAEVDQLAERIQAEGKGAMGPSVPELKGNLASSGSGLDASGKVWPERIYGLEDWIDQGVVTMHWMRYKDSKRAPRFHQDMLQHCVDTYSASSDWLVHLDVDEFLAVAPTLYSSDEPQKSSGPSSAGWQYPLHDLLERQAIRDAACVPIPSLQYRNMGVRHLRDSQSLLQIQSKRDVAEDETVSFKTLIHPNYEPGFVSFDGAHTCRISTKPAGPSRAKTVKNARGKVLHEGPGVFSTAVLPYEPLAIAHYIQRDLEDCRAKLSSIDDPNNIREKGRGTVTCEEHYLPSPEELASPAFKADKQNRFLAQLPEEGTIVDDSRVKDSWASRAAAAVLREWSKSPADHALAAKVRESIIMLQF